MYKNRKNTSKQLQDELDNLDFCDDDTYIRYQEIEEIINNRNRLAVIKKHGKHYLDKVSQELEWCSWSVYSANDIPPKPKKSRYGNTHRPQKAENVKNLIVVYDSCGNSEDGYHGLLYVKTKKGYFSVAWTD